MSITAVSPNLLSQLYLCIQAWRFIPYQTQIPSRRKAKESEMATHLNGYIYPSILIHTVTVTIQSSLGEKSMSLYHSQLQSFESLHWSQLVKLRAGLHGSEVLHGTPLLRQAPSRTGFTSHGLFVSALSVFQQQMFLLALKQLWPTTKT